jgi:hypothetical protein
VMCRLLIARRQGLTFGINKKLNLCFLCAKLRDTSCKRTCLAECWDCLADIMIIIDMEMHDGMFMQITYTTRRKGMLLK